MASKKVACLKNGGPGGGKGTDAKVIAGELGFQQFEMGPHLIQLRQRDSTLDAVMKETTDIGLYVPDEFALPILEQQLRSELPDQFVADGITRTEAQARKVLAILREHGYRVITINYHVPPNEDRIFFERMAIRDRKGETLEVRKRRVMEYRKHNPAVEAVFENWKHHFYRTIDGRVEHQERLSVIRTIVADAPGARPIRDGLASYALKRDRRAVVPAEYCSSR